MLGERALAAIGSTTSTSFACDLRKWLEIMEAYQQGGHAYHATMPTDGLLRLWDVMHNPPLRLRQGAPGADRAGLEDPRPARLRGLHSVAARGFMAPSVVVGYTEATCDRRQPLRRPGLQTRPAYPAV